MQAGGSIRCYQYDLVYPAKGREFQLEQVRASLPQYKPTPTSNIQVKVTSGVCCYQKDQVYPHTGGEFQPEQVRAMLTKYQCSCDMEMTEISRTNVTVFVPSHVKDMQCSMEQELEELMCSDKPPATSNLQPSSLCGDGFEQALRLELEQGKDITAASSFSGLQNKENEENKCYSRGKYTFTPDSVIGAPDWPVR